MNALTGMDESLRDGWMNPFGGMIRMGSLAGTDESLREEGWIPSESGMDGGLDGRVMVITGYGSIESAVTAIKKGAYDFIPKPFQMDELGVIVKRALERHTLFRQLGIFRGLTLALIISVPFWLILGIVLALIWK